VSAWPGAWVRSDAPWRRPRRVAREQALRGIDAPAKLNLGLAIVGRRVDGYHKLVTLMTTLALADTVRVEPADDLSLVCDDPRLPTGDDNLCLRAARSLRGATGTAAGARITLTKRIPIAAGLGGGSSDAAATLVALDALWGTRVPDDVLLHLGKSLGADVPFALYGGTMLARGIGDVLTLAASPDAWVVLIVPRAEIARKTAALYGALDERDFSMGTAVAQQAARLRRGEPISPELLGNAFLAPLERLAPVVAETRHLMESLGAPAFLSGSGPTLYALRADLADATTCADRLRGALDATAIVTRIAASDCHS
jgi:4-diphosphocytidyl-2-C-methyl-D-erythritol kinase